ncbi:MAG: ATP-binding protein [Bifidobacteriaceae bacterium]|jgi:hypothetical protein|nr:ATP-binding protein [Bifidobacteriaceae bacterium]
MASNPFTPTFGHEPRVLAGRGRLISDIVEGLENGPGDPNRSTILIGPLGSGKTVLLDRIAKEVAPNGWITASVTCHPGMLIELTEQVRLAGSEHLPSASTKRLSGLSIKGFSYTSERLPQVEPTWRSQITELIETLNSKGIGLLLLVDEINAAEPELIQLVVVYQHLVRESRNAALIMAGLPGKVMQLFHHQTVSFLRRAFQHRLDAISAPEAEVAIDQTVRQAGKTIEADALRQAAADSAGFPFLIQLIGFHAWRQASGAMITLEHVLIAAKLATADMDRMILETTVLELSRRELEFVRAMAQDDPDSLTADIAARMAVSLNSAAQYRRRLIQRGVIAGAGYGRVRFELPMLRDYLRRNHPIS